jgi:CO/xanthine dehydrogenase FAD-binding subunit
MTRRQTLDITIVGAASQVVLDGPDGAVTGVRIFASSVAPVPLRLAETEKRVLGQELDDATLAAAAEAASQEVKPIDDLRGEAWYRRHASGVLVRRTLTAAGRRASGGRESGEGEP